MRATVTQICPFCATTRVRVTTVGCKTADTHFDNYSVAELIQAQLNSGATLYIPRRVK